MDNRKPADEDQFFVAPVAEERPHVTPRGDGAPLGRGKGAIVCIERSRVMAFVVDAGGAEVVTRLVSDQGIPDTVSSTEVPGALLDLFGEALGELPKSTRTVRVILGEPHLTVRHMHLPAVKPSKIKQLVGASGRTNGTPRAGFRIQGPSYQNGNQGLAVEAVFATDFFMNGLEKQALSHGCRIKWIGSRPFGGLAWLQAFGTKEDRDGRFLLMEVRREYVRLGLIDDGKAVFSRAVDLGGAVRPEDVASTCITEVQRTNIFMGSRLREKPADRIVTIGDDGAILDTVTERVGDQFDVPITAVAPRSRVADAMGAIAEGWVHDAAAAIVAPSAVSIGVVKITSASRDQRERAFMIMPVSILFAFGVLAMAWRLDRNAQFDLRVARHDHGSLRGELDAVPPEAKRYAAMQEARAMFEHQVAELEAALGFTDPVDEVLLDLTERLPDSIVITRAEYKVAAPPVSDEEAETMAELGPEVSTVIIEGRAIVSMVQGPGLMKQVVRNLAASPYVGVIHDDSGNYDPFQRSDGDPLASQYPVVLVIELKESS